MTDELVSLAGTGPGMLGVLAHEAGHIAQRHGLQQIIQASAVGALAAYMFGDFSSVLAGVPAAMLTLRYSREHEREADAYAIDIMQRNRLPPSALADVLLALQGQNRSADKNKPAPGANAEEPALDDFLSTHPHTRERIEALRAAGS